MYLISLQGVLLNSYITYNENFHNKILLYLKSTSPRSNTITLIGYCCILKSIFHVFFIITDHLAASLDILVVNLPNFINNSLLKSLTVGVK